MALLKEEKITMTIKFLSIGGKILHMKEKYYNKNILEILSLYTSDYSARFHLRKISNLIGKDTKTTSLNLNRLEKIRVLNSEKIGKHKEFSLNTKNRLTKYFLIMSEIYRTVEFLRKNFKIRKIAELVTDRVEVAVIFGSYAKGLATDDSDLDLIIVNGNLNEIVNDIENLYGIKISPKYFSKREFIRSQKNKDSFFIEILNSHIILNGFDFFINTTWRNYYGY